LGGIKQIREKKTAVSAMADRKMGLPQLNLSAKAPKDGLAMRPTKGKTVYMIPTPLDGMPNCLASVGTYGKRGAVPIT